MVEPEHLKSNNPDITFFLALMHSPLIGNKNIINGHAIYNALLRTGKFKPADLEKVSFGIAQNEPVTYEGFNKYITNVEEEAKIKTDAQKKKKESRTILDNLKKGYDGVIVLRSTQNILTNPLIDHSPIPFDIIKAKHGACYAHKITYFVFYVIWKNGVPEIEFKDMEIAMGAARNSGFGFTRIERAYNTTMEDIVAGAFDEFTARNGISGIYNHSKYGFGEFMITKKANGDQIIKLITPLCMKSSFPKSTIYRSLPTFIKPMTYDKVKYYIWDKGQEHVLDCIQSVKAIDMV